MENKLNLVEILKDCPKGMELYSPLCGDCKLYDVNDYNIKIEIPNKDSLIILRHDGTYYVNGEIMLFPKGKTSWEGFHRPFKNGDVLFVDCSDDEDKSYQYIFILNKPEFYGKWHSHCHLDGVGHFHSKETYLTDDEYHPRFATEEEKEKLFDAIKANGHRWDDETKTLEKLTPKFKDGDIVATKSGLQVFILQRAKSNTKGYCYNTKGYCYIGYDFEFNEFFDADEWEFDRLATEEERQKLLKAIEDDGYTWDPETKTLEKIVPKFIPKFKVGDKIQNKENEIQFTITKIHQDCYECDDRYVLTFENQDNWDLVPNKFDINSLVPFESRVLVRDYSYEVWRVSFWGCLVNSGYGFIHDTTRGCYKQCIPYEGNEHLLGKTDCCNDFYKNWK